MKNWYFNLAEFRPEVGFEFRFNGKGKDGHTNYDHICVVTEVVNRKKLAYSWRYDGYTGNSFVTFELFPEGNMTRLKLTHKGLETFPADPAFARQNFVEGWTQIIGTNLPGYLQK